MMNFFSAMNMSDPAACQAGAIPPELAELVEPTKDMKGRRRSNRRSLLEENVGNILGGSSRNLTGRGQMGRSISYDDSNSKQMFASDDENDEQNQRRRNRRRGGKRGGMQKQNSVSNLGSSMSDQSSSSISSSMLEHMEGIEKFALLLKGTDQTRRNQLLRDALLSRSTSR